MIKMIADENIPHVTSAFAALGDVVTLPGRKITQADLIDSDILLVRSVTTVNQALLEGTAVKFVATATSGTNHIDINYLNQHNIVFADALGSNAMSVAQYVLSAISYWSLQHQKSFNQLTVGIIGCGQVGSRLQHLCELFGMRTVIHDPPLATKTNPANTNRWSDMDAVLACDVISIHVPFNTTGPHATSNLISQKRIQQLKSGSLLINTSRGEVIDEEALLNRLLNRSDLSLVLDVWRNEPNINLQLLAHTLIGTAHIAGYAFDGKIRGTQMIYQACCHYLNQPAVWSVDDLDLCEYPVQVIDETDLNHLPQSLLSAYSIEADNLRLKQLLKPNQLNSHEFDGLRKNYPIRREWRLANKN